MNLKKQKKELLFVPLGGSGEIGMNVNLYHLDGKWLMVDLGAGFADDWMPGIDMIVADISFIQERKQDLLGIVLTHAHEDHLGAIQYLWNELECPVYATPFTGAFLQEKLLGDGYKKGDVPIHIIDEGCTLNLGPFDIELVQITHSVPEMNAVFLRTPHGNILHTGDWKLDPNPTVGATTDFDKLEAFGKEGVKALICDSTNVFNKGTSGSEGDLRDSLIDLIAGCDKLVAVTTFASNVARITNLIEAGKKAGRKVALAGRSLHRVLKAAQASGYMLDIPDLIDTREIKNHPREKMLVICTGCQGDPLAATNKLVNGTHPDFRLKPGDTVIFSSKIIPGNEKRIFRLYNLLAKQKVEVYTERDHFVHVSGHPSRDELQHMYELVQPEISIPVHGELVHMHEHARLAKSWGAKQAIETENGQIIRLSGDTPECIGYVDSSGYFGVDGNTLISPDSNVMRMRRRIQRDGVITITLITDKKGKLLTSPSIITPGVLDKEEDKDIIDAISEEIEDAVHDSHSKAKRITAKNTENVIRAATRRILKTELGKNPPIEIEFKVLS